MNVIIWILWIFKTRKNSWILRSFKIHKIRILNLCCAFYRIYTLCMTLTGLVSADVPLRNYPPTHCRPTNSVRALKRDVKKWTANEIRPGPCRSWSRRWSFRPVAWIPASGIPRRTPRHLGHPLTTPAELCRTADSSRTVLHTTAARAACNYTRCLGKKQLDTHLTRRLL